MPFRWWVKASAVVCGWREIRNSWAFGPEYRCDGRPGNGSLRPGEEDLLRSKAAGAGD